MKEKDKLVQWAHEQKKSNYEKIANLHKTIKTSKHKSKVEVHNLQVRYLK